MEKDPSNNPENINQQPAADENAERQPLPYEEEMDKRQHYERLFNEMKQNGTLPEGVTDPYELREYTEENQAREAEQDKANKEARAEYDEHCKRLIAEVLDIKDPKDKNMAITMLSTLTSGKNIWGREDLKASQDYQDVFLEYINRDEKDVSIEEFIVERVEDTNKSEQDRRKYRIFPLDRAVDSEEFAEIQTINDDSPEVAEKKLEKMLAEKNLGYLVSYGFESYGRRYTKHLEIDSPFNWEPNDFIERPASDRGIIVSMAKDIINQIDGNDPNVTKQRYLKNKLTVIGQLYNGKNFDKQLKDIEDFLIQAITDDANNNKEKTDIGNVIRTSAILEISRKFSGMRHRYVFMKKYQQADGQAILDNFKNNSRA